MRRTETAVDPSAASAAVSSGAAPAGPPGGRLLPEGYPPKGGHPAVATIRAMVRSTLGEAHCTLAVSGGVDSMVLLDAAASVRPPTSLVVATFDHGTGRAAESAAQAVAGRAGALGIPSVIGRATSPGRTEAEWRRGRWHFLHDVARRTHTTVVTAHTRDDQIETVFMRILRDAGPRGLASLYADSSVLRPFLTVPRAMILEYASERRLRFVTDPSNTDRRYLRNRIRHDLLPAMLTVRPALADELLDLAHRSAAWRAQMDHIAATFTIMPDPTGSEHLVPRVQLTGFSLEALRALWPTLAARVGIVMDRRGTHRLASFTIEGATGQSIQLSGGVDVLMGRDAMVLRRGTARD